MANSDKDIRIVPNRNKSGLPNIAFTGYNNDPIVLNVLDDNTISFEGSSGQLFSVSNAVTTGTIFSVNDISGIPSFRIDADGTVGIAEFSGNVGIGLQSPQSKLSVGGDINVGAGYTFRVAGTKVLDSFSLGTGVTQSSLTSLGTITSGTWQGTAIGVNYGGTGATNASDARSFLGAATAGTNSDLTRLLGVQHLFVTIPTAAAIGITVKAATSQSASMMEFVNSSNSLLAWITKDGTFAHGAYFTHNDGRVPGISVQRANAAGIVARGFNSDAFPAIEVQNNGGGLGVGLYPGGLVYGGVLQAWASTASTNTTTGALIVAGGAAIAGTTNFGRDVRIFSSLASSSPFTGSLVVSGGVGISNNLFVGGGVAFTASIASTSTATGTLVVTGGVGIGGSVFTSTSNASSISGVVLSNGSVTLTGTYTQSNSSTTAFSVKDGSNTTAFNIDTIADIISIPVAVASTSTGTGSLVVAGGVGIGGTANIKSAYVYNDLLHIPGTGNTFGMSFTSFTLPTGFTGSGLYAIYAENRFVATGGSVVAYSDDLINWTTSYIPWNASVYNQSITYGNGVYVVTSSVNSYVAYSRDLLTWTLASVQYQNYQTAAYGNGRFVINAGGVVGISTNGANWSSLSPTGSAPNYQALKFQNGYFYSSSSRSVDGIAWEPLNISISVGNISYGNGLYFGAQYNSSNYAYSYDGVNFTTATIANNVYVGTEYHNGVYYLRTQHNNAILYYSTDGLNYQGLSFSGVGQFAMAFGKNKIVVFGRDGSSGVYAYYAEGTNGKIDLNPIREGNIDNTVIGSRTPKPANFTDLSTTGYVNIVNRAGSASSTSGALVVRGGVGIGGSLYVASPAAISGVIINSGTITGSLTGTATTATYSHQSGYAITSGFATSSSTATLASSASTSYSVNVNSALTNSSHYLIFSPNASGSGIALSTESSLVYNPSTDILSASGLAVTSGTPTTSTTSGALVVVGGVGIGGSVNISGIVRSGQLIAPTFTLAALGGTGALTPSTTYYYKLSSLDYFGNESLPSNEVSIALNSSTYAVNINPSIDQSIYAIKIYRTTTSNSYTNSLVDTYYPFRGGQNASYTPYNYYDRGKPTTASSPATVPNANRAVLGSSTNSTMGKLNLSGQLLIQNKNTSAPSNNIGIQLGNYDIAAVRNGVLTYLSSITSATGGTLAAGTTYYYVYTGIDSYGNETFPSIEYAFTADSNGAAQMNFAGGDYGLLKYRFYRTTTPGNYTNSYIGELPSSIDLNYPTQNVSPPTSSSANAYVLKSVPAENIPSYIDSLDIRPGMSGAVRKLADNQYNTLSGIVTSGIAGTLSQNTIYYYKVASYDRYGNTSSASIPYLINTGPATSVQITPMFVDWPASVEGFLVYRSTSKDNFTNVPTFYAYPGTAITDTGNYEFLSTAPTTNNYLLGNFGGYYYGYANFYMRSLDLAAGGNQSSFNILSGRSPQPTVSAATGGTLTPGDVYYYKVMAFGRGDDYSMASPAVRFVIGAGGAARISVNSIGITGFRHYNIYRTADLSNWTNSQIARYVSESDFVDIGYPGTSGSPVGHTGLKRGTTTTISDGAITTSTIRVNSFTQDIPAPQSISISGTTGGILTTGTTYYYRILPVGVSWSEFGQASKQVIYTTSSSENAISLSWGAVHNATGYRVMRSTTNNAGAGQTYTFVHGTSFVDKGYSSTTHPYDPYALYYPGSYGATFSANLGRYHLPFLNLTNGDSPNLYISLLPPTISSTSTGTGGTLANNTDYYYIIEAFDYNNGSSLPSTEVVVNTGANNAVTLNWNEKNGAFYYKIYRSSNSDFTNKQINQTVYGTTFTDINYPTVNTSPRYSSTNGSMFRLGSAHNAGVYYGLLSRSVFQATPTTQGAYGTDFSVRVAGRPAGSIYGALFELGDFASTGYNGTSYGTYFGLSSATGFTGNYIDFQSSSISRFKVDYLGNATIGSTTGSGSTSTGALVVTGGVGIGQSLFTSPSYSSSISGAIFSNGSATLSGSFTQNNSSATAFQVRDGSNNPAFVIDTIGDIISLPVAVASTSTGTGSLVVVGGVGIGQSINIGGRVGIGTNLLDATLNIRTSTAATPGIVVQGSTSQSASLFRVNSSVGGSFFEITNSGIVNIKTSTAGDYNSVPLQRWYGDSNSIVGVMQKGGFFYTGNGLGYVDDVGTQTLVHQWVPASSYYITNWSQRMANGGSIQFASPAGGAIHVSGDTNGSLTFTSFGTYTNNTMVKLKDPNYGTNQALLGIVTQDGSYTRSQLFSYGNLALNMTVAGSAGTDWDTTNLFRANVNTKTRYLGNLAVLAVDDTNRFVVGPYGNTTVALGGTTVSTGFIIKAASSQTGNLFEAQSSTGATITFIDASGDLSIGASTASTSSTTGALIVTGGVGIGQTLNVAGNATIGGTLNVSGTNSYIQNNLYVGNANQGRLYFSQATLGSAGTTVIPSMAFIGATNSPITLSVLPDNSLSFDGSSGQLFSINNNLSTGWIFAINDISGLPIFRTNADLTVAMGEYGGNVGIGLSNPTFKLQVSGNAGISGTTLISNTTTSTNTTSGALVVSGGVGIGGSLNVTSASLISGVTINSGVITGSLTGTATTSNYSYQAGYAITSGSANTALYSDQSGYGITSGFATTASYSYQSGYGITAGLATTATYAHQSGYAITSGSSNTSNFATSSGLATTATYAHQSGYAITSTSSGSATTAANVNVVSASTSASHPVLFTPATGTASGAALSTETSFVYNPSTDILSVSGLAITSTTASTNSGTGALRVAGGVGISGELYLNNNTGTSNFAFFSGSTNQPAGVTIHNTTSGSSAASQLTLNNNNSSSFVLIGVGSTNNNFISAFYGSNIPTNFGYMIGGGGFGADSGGLSVGAGSTLILFAKGPGHRLTLSGTGLSIFANVPSTSTSTGGLTVTGGVGIGGTSYFGQDVKILGSTASTSPTTGALVVTGGVGIGGTLNVGNSSVADVIIYNTDYTSSANLKLRTGTGASLKEAVIGFNSTELKIENVFRTITNYADVFQFYATNLDDYQLIISSAGATFYNTTASTSSTTGALRLQGGAGIAKTSYFGQDVKIQGTTSSGSTTTGALTVTGGVGIGQTLFTSSSYASSISGVILNNGAITNTGTITSTGVMSLSNSSTTALSIKDGSNSTKFNVNTIGGVVSVSSSTASTNTLTGALVVGGGLGVSGDVFICGNANSKLNIMQSSGDEGGEIFLNKPVTNTTISNGVSIDIYQNRLRFFESGGSNRGYYIDITAGGNGVTTNLVGGGGGGSGTVTTLTAGTGISFSTGSTITTTGTIRARRPMVASFCAGYTPAASGADSVVIRLPDSPSDGTTAITYEPQEFHIRVETPSATTTTIQLEKYTGTGAFSGTAITSISISGGSTYEAQTSVFAGAGIFLTSGDKLRINFTALSASHANFSVYLELEEV